MKTHCKRGHDTSLPGSRYAAGACKKCQTEHNTRCDPERDFRAEVCANPRRKVQKMLRAAKERSKRDGKEFNITIDDLGSFPTHCPVFGSPLEYTTYGKGNKGKGVVDTHPSLDRVDNSKGYIPGNVKIISYKANLLKSSNTIESLELILKYIKETQWHQLKV